MGGPDLASLFGVRPPHWGLRGDPGLWDELTLRFAQTPLPPTFADLWRTLEEAFLDAVGQPLTQGAPVPVGRFDTGGMSSGLVDPKAWATMLFPLISQRYANAMHAADSRDQNRKVL